MVLNEIPAALIVKIGLGLIFNLHIDRLCKRGYFDPLIPKETLCFADVKGSLHCSSAKESTALRSCHAPLHCNRVRVRTLDSNLVN